MTWSYSGDPSLTDKDAVRFEIQDTNSSSQLLQDEEIQWAILAETTTAAGSPTTISGANLYSAAARCMEVLARLFSAQADTQVGTLKLTYTKQAANYTLRAQELRQRAMGYRLPYAGGLSEQEKENITQETDRIQPAFTRTEWDSPFTGNQFGFDSNLGPPVR